MKRASKLIELFRSSGLTESEKIQLNNLDWAKLVLDENDEVLIQNEHGSKYDVDELDNDELKLFISLFEVKENKSIEVSLEDAKDVLILCIEDIELLISGDWEPDEDSANATLDNLIKVKKYLDSI
jgi:hypothetical protein